MQSYEVRGGVETLTDYEYDQVGNETARRQVGGVASTTLMRYNKFNQLVSISKNGATTTYTYRPDGLRHGKTVSGTLTTHIWDGQNIVAELAANGTVKSRFLRGMNLIAQQIDSETQYYLFNAHSDVKQKASANGTILKRYDYDAFGVEKASEALDQNPFRYCGEYFDKEAETYYLRARHYNPRTGRFGAEDPAKSGLNWYTYCGNNPVMLIDPSGMREHSSYSPTKQQNRERHAARMEMEQRASDARTKHWPNYLPENFPVSTESTYHYADRKLTTDTDYGPIMYRGTMKFGHTEVKDRYQTSYEFVGSCDENGNYIRPTDDTGGLGVYAKQSAINYSSRLGYWNENGSGFYQKTVVDIGTAGEQITNNGASGKVATATARQTYVIAFGGNELEIGANISGPAASYRITKNKPMGAFKPDPGVNVKPIIRFNPAE